jgi:integrase
MAGSIRKRADRGPNVYELRVFLGRDHNGKVRHKNYTFRGSLRAAEMELARLVTEQAAEPDPIPLETAFGPTTTINMAIEAWKENGWQDLSPSTTRRYNSIWTTHIKDSIGRRRITSLGPYDVEVYLRGLKASGLSEASVRQTRAILHRSCRLARKWSGNGLPNPVSGTEMPYWVFDEQSVAVRAPSTEEVQALFAASKTFGARMHGFVAVIASTGMRRGEACALRWSDIDFTVARLTIDESVVAADGGAQVKASKSRAGVRTVAIDRTTLATLVALRTETDGLAALGEFVTEPQHFVFATELPGIVPPYPDAMSHAFGRVRVAAGVPADDLHSLRHFQAAALDPIISEAQKQSRLGWSTVHMARHYTDGLEEEDRRAAEHMGVLLGGGVVDAVPQVGQTPESGGVNRSVTPS